MMHYTELQHIGFYLTNYADRLVGIKLALRSAQYEATHKYNK